MQRRHCGHCDVEGAKLRCGRCRALFFCSAKCQRANWRSHKGVCRKGPRGAPAPALLLQVLDEPGLARAIARQAASLSVLFLKKRPAVGDASVAALAPAARRIVWDDEVSRPGGAVLFRASGSGGQVSCCDFSLDGRLVLTASSDETVRLFDARTGLCLQTLKGGGSRCAFSMTDGCVFVTGVRSSARVWGGPTPRTLGHGPAGSTVNSCACHGDRVVTAGTDRSVKLWTASSGTMLTTFQNTPEEGGGLTCCAFAHDGGRVVASNALQVWIWAAADDPGYALLVTWELPENSFMASRCRCCRFSPDDSRLVTASSGFHGGVYLWHAATGEPDVENIPLLGGGDDDGGSPFAAFSADGSRLVTADDDGAAKLWNSKTGDRLTTFLGHTQKIPSCALSNDGTRLVTASNDGTTRLWNVPAGL